MSSKRVQSRGRSKTKPQKPRNSKQVASSTSAFPVYGPLAFFPPVLHTKFPYNATLILAASTGLNTYLFNSNNMYDPDYTGTGHQPRGWDQANTYYKYYRVKSVTLDVSATWNAIPDAAYYVGVFVDSDATITYTSFQDFIERYGPSKFRVLKPSVLASVKLPRIKVDLDKLSNKALSVQRTAVSSAPDLPGPRLGIWWGRMDGGTPSYYPLIICNLVYECELFEPTDIGSS